MPTGPNAIELDLRGVDGFVSAIEWIRNHIVLGVDKHPAMQLDVLLPGGGRVALFMNTANHYILGFRGKDKIYLLKDDHIEEFANKLVVAGLAGKGDLVRVDIGADHNTLATLNRTFGMAELRRAAELSEYKPGTHLHEQVRAPISLLICMIAEAARLRTMEWAFRAIYLDLARVSADEAIQSWQDACGIIRLAEKYFPRDLRWVAVERLEKRATELGNLIPQIDTGGTSGPKEAIQKLLDGKGPKAIGTSGYAADRVREMARELKLSSGKDVTAADLMTMVISCRNKAAIRAAKDGVAVPGA